MSINGDTEQYCVNIHLLSLKRFLSNVIHDNATLYLLTNVSNIGSKWDTHPIILYRLFIITKLLKISLQHDKILTKISHQLVLAQIEQLKPMRNIEMKR